MRPPPTALLHAARGIALLPVLATLGALGLACGLLVVYRRHLVDQLRETEGVHGAHLWMGEHGPIESAQLVVLTLLAFQGTLLIPLRRHLGWIVLLAALVVLVREVDWFLEGHIRRHAHRPLMAVLAGGLAVVAVRGRTRLLDDLRGLPGACCALLACGILLLVAAQVLGHPELWTLVARDGEAVRVAKRFVEEGLETLAYLVALAAAVVLGRTLGTQAGPGRRPLTGPSSVGAGRLRA